MKLLLTVLLLIVLPTAWLSLLAGRSIQARELLVERRLVTEAQDTLALVGAEARLALDAALDRLSDVVQDTILKGDDVRQFDVAVSGLKDRDPLFNDVYLFLQPWGFIYPEQAEPEILLPENQHALLAQQLAMHFSDAHQRRAFAAGERLYVFALIQADLRLYVGYEIVPDGLLALIEDKLGSHSTPYIAYRILGVGPVQTPAEALDATHLAVHDTFSPYPETLLSTADFLPDTHRGDFLVSGRLPAPFDHIALGAVAVNTRDIQAARALQGRLVGWSILLLAFVLLSSAVILILLSRRQALRARMRSIFIAGLSHDIRTPVTAMRALAESLQQGRVTAEDRKQQFLDSIVVECDHLQILIERVLLFFRQEQGGYYQKKSLSLVVLCEQVGNTFCARHRGRVDLTLDLPVGEFPTMWGDLHALEQVLHNLLENAWKYGRPSPEHPDQVVPITLRLSVAPGCLWRRCLFVAIEDAGPGVVASEQHRVFDRFYRGLSPFVAQAGGIGLGLALVREIVRSHGGRVYVESSPQGGARFVLRFKPFPLGAWRQRYVSRCFDILRTMHK